MTTLCFNSVENDPYAKKGLDVKQNRVNEIIAQVLRSLFLTTKKLAQACEISFSN